MRFIASHERFVTVLIWSFKTLSENSCEHGEQERQRTHNVTVARSRNYTPNGNATMHSVFIVELRVSVNNIKLPRLVQQCFCNEFMSLAAIKKTLGLYVNCLIFLLDFNRIWTLTDFHESTQYQISRKYVQWEPCWYIRTDGHDEANRHFLRLHEGA
jgi:hypothetical protein